MLRDRLAAASFQLDDVSACCEVNVWAGAGRGCVWLDEIDLPIWTWLSNHHALPIAQANGAGQPSYDAVIEF